MKAARTVKVCGTQTSPPQAWNNSKEQPIKRTIELEKLFVRGALLKRFQMPEVQQHHQVVSWTDYFGLSTCAAVVHFGNFWRQPVWVRLVWIVTLIVGIAFTASSSYSSAVTFLRASARSEMLIEKISDSRLDFPKFHICTTNTFNVSVLRDWGLGDSQMVSYLQLSSSGMAVSPTIITNETLQKAMASRLDKMLSIHNLTMKKIYERALLKCEDIVHGCMMPGLQLDGAGCCARFFGSSSFPALTGACITSRSAQFHSQVMSSFAFGFVVIIRSARPTFTLDNSIVNPVFGNKRGVFFSVSDKWTNPFVSLVGSRQYARAGLASSLAITKQIINDEAVTRSLLARRQCARREDENLYRHLVPANEHYTETNCMYTLRQNEIAKMFDCKLIAFPGSDNLQYCKPDAFVELTRRIHKSSSASGTEFHRLLLDNADCVSECVREVYSISSSSADYDLGENFRFGNWSINANESAELVALHFYYPSFTYTHQVNHYPTMHELLGILGGNLGLFLGASMVSIVELFVFFIYCCRLPR